MKTANRFLESKWGGRAESSRRLQAGGFGLLARSSHTFQTDLFHLSCLSALAVCHNTCGADLFPVFWGACTPFYCSSVAINISGILTPPPSHAKKEWKNKNSCIYTLALKSQGQSVEWRWKVQHQRPCSQFTTQYTSKLLLLRALWWKSCIWKGSVKYTEEMSKILFIKNKKKLIEKASTWL